VDDFGNFKLATHLVNYLCVDDVALNEWNVANPTFVTKLK
jgi:hypothetical protein